MKNYRIGILGGGQLGKMLCLAGGEMDMNISIMENDRDCPAAPYCTNFVKGNINKFEDVLRFGEDLDAVSIEIEKVNTSALRGLLDKGVKVYPSPEIIEMIQDKGTQKDFFANQSIPTSAYRYCDNVGELKTLLSSGEITFPFVQKLRRDGYDGRGVLVCKSMADASSFFDAPCVIEEMVGIAKEIAVIICRNAVGNIAIYDPVEMVFDPEANLLDYQLAPARIPPEIVRRSQDIAFEIAEKIDLVGLLAIEMFLTLEGDLLVNEMAPRPHNSGHHTIEACHTSQYTNLLRVLRDQSVGSPKTIKESLLINLLGSENYTGPTNYGGLDEILKLKGSNLHLYGKKMSKPKRKMGHVTVLNDDDETYDLNVKKIKSSFKTDRN